MGFERLGDLTRSVFPCSGGQNLPFLQEFNFGSTRDPNARAARAFAAEIHSTHNLALLNQLAQVLSANMQKARELPDCEEIAGRYGRLALSHTATL